jgi:hypothetical protein
MKHSTTWILVAMFLITLGYIGPAIDGYTFYQNQASMFESVRAFHQAARQQCGENAGWVDLGDGWVQCYLHTGQKSKIVQLHP